MTTSPPCRHEVAWWPRGSSTAPGQKGQDEAVDVSRPSHPLIATWHSSESRCMFKPTEGWQRPKNLHGGQVLTTCELYWLVKQKKLELGTYVGVKFKDRAFC